MKPKEEFIELNAEGCKIDGLGNLTSKIIGVGYRGDEINMTIEKMIEEMKSI